MRAVRLMMAAMLAGVVTTPAANVAALAPATAAATQPTSPQGRGPGANLREQWVAQARAADAIGEVLMAASAPAEARVERVRQELAKAGEKVIPGAAKSAATGQSQAAYRAVFDHVVAEVQRLPAHQVDPSLVNLPDGQLFSEMVALQSYNLRTVRRLAELRDEADDLRRRLAKIGRADDDAATQPTIPSMDDLSREAAAALWRPQRSEQWAAARQKMRNAIATSRDQQLRVPPTSSTPAASSPYPPPANAVVVDDPRWQPYYYGPGDEFGWWGGAMYEDPYTFRGGGGVYERYDTRVNVDSDTRTRGQSDRRVNVQFDRRLNVHFDPRENF